MRFLITLLVFIFLHLDASAQHRAIGFSLEANYVNQSGDGDLINDLPDPVGILGAHFRYKRSLTEVITFEPYFGLQYHRGRSTARIPNPMMPMDTSLVDSERTIHTSHFDFGFNVQYVFPPLEVGVVSIYVGPKLQLLAGAKESLSYEFNGESVVETTDPSFESAVISAVCGVHYNRRINEKLYIDIGLEAQRNINSYHNAQKLNRNILGIKATLWYSMHRVYNINSDRIPGFR